MQIKRLRRPFEIKEMDEEAGIFTGYGSVFGNKDSYNEIVVRGAFSKFLSSADIKSVKLLWQHKSDAPIGVWKSIEEDEKGLLMTGKLLVNDVQKARESYALLNEGAISGLSIGFMVKEGGANIGSDGLKYLTDLELWETSLVTFPANTLATVTSVKTAYIEKINNIKDFEKCLRDLGISKKKALVLASVAAKGFQDRSDSGESEFIHALHGLAQSIKSEVLKNESGRTSSVL